MSDKVISTKDIPQEELAIMWEDCHKEKVKLQSENKRLQKDSKHWRKEAEMLERIIANRHLNKRT